MPRQRLTKRKDEYFKCKYHGKQFYGKTQAEANRRREEYIAQEKAGLDFTQGTASFHDYAQGWLDIYRNECSKQQRKQYCGMIDFASDSLSNPPIKDITARDLQIVCNTLSCYSASYINKFMSTLKSVFTTAVAEGAMLHNPMDAVKRPKAKRCEGHRALEAWERDLICSTYAEHDFGPAAMTTLFTGLHRGEVLFINIDRDVDFTAKTLTVHGAVSFPNGTDAVPTAGKTQAALRTIPLAKPLETALSGCHGLLCPKEDGDLMTQTAFTRKYESYICFLETKLNGCKKRWYGKTRAHKALLAEGKSLPPWKEINIRCHEFRVDFCTRAFQAGIPIKTLQAWMGHEDPTMIFQVYAKLTEDQERADALKITSFLEANTKPLVDPAGSCTPNL